MDRLLQDIRFAIRTLAKAPMFTALCVLCLSIGIGLNASIYSAVYSVFMRPFEYADPDRLVWIAERHDKRGWDEFPLSFETFQDLQAGTPNLAQSGGLSFRSLTLSDGDEPVRLRGALVSWNLFPMLGVTPVLGRAFTPDDDRPGAAPVLLLSHGVWATRYAGDSSIIGRGIVVNGAPHVIVGVMPKGFLFPEREEAWTPIGPILEGQPRGAREVSMIGRLRPDADVEATTVQLSEVSRRLEHTFPEEHEDWRAYAIPLRDQFIDGDTKLVIAAMMGAVTFVLLIACANVANLLLAKATTRGREVAIRSALGAGRGRIVRQMLTESVLLGLLSAPLGIGIAYWVLDLVVASIPESDLPYYYVFAIDGPVLAYTAAVAVVTGLVFGLAPALHAVRGNLQAALKDGGRGSGTGSTRNRMRTTLAVGEIALSLVVLVGASLFVRSFLNLREKTGGIESANLLTLRFFMPGERYATADALTQRVADVVQRVEALPGVVSATASNLIPLDGGGTYSDIEIDGRPATTRADAPSAYWSGVTERWFGTLGVSFLAGRNFTAQEARDSSAVAIVNETMARRFWPDTDPLGRRFRMVADGEPHWFTIIGVTRDFKPDDLDDNEAIEPGFFVSYRYLATRNTGLTVRAERDPAQLSSAVRTALRASDPAMPVFGIATMEEVRHTGMWSQRLFGWLFSLFGVVALVLASVGVYGVIAFGVSQRTQEIGVRVALGAQSGDVIRLVVRNGALVATAGILLGLIAALGVTRVLQSLLVEVSATDPVSFIGVTAFLAAVALVASYVPARRATRVDPLTALRHE